MLGQFALPQWLTPPSVMVPSGHMDELFLLLRHGDLHGLPTVQQHISLADVHDTDAREGLIEVLRWAKHQDPPVSWSSACMAAAEQGELGVLQWLRSHEPPCPWSEDTCTAAAQSGQLRSLQWLRRQEPCCPWSEDTCTAAAQSG